MSTRATYRFKDEAFGAVTFYIHHDGYPEGAASYFMAMHKCENKRAGLANQFIRSNDGAEITRSHECHGDTEYRYTIANNILSAEKAYYDGDKKTWREFYLGHWAEFTNKYYEGGAGLFILGGGIVMTIPELERQINEKEISLKNYGEKFGKENGNYAYAATELDAKKRLLEQLTKHTGE